MEEDFYSSRGRYIEVNGEFYDTSEITQQGPEHYILNHLRLNLRCLVSLKLVKCGLRNFPRDLVNAAPLLRVLDLTGNEISELPSGLQLDHLGKLVLAQNKISRLSENAFMGLSSCTEIDLSQNLLKGSLKVTLPDTLTSLYLGCNEITRIAIHQPSLRLSVLDLQSNQIKGGLDNSFFQSVRNLTFLSLSKNQVEFLSPSISKFMTRLNQLYLQDNQLDFVCTQLFSGEMERLAVLDVSGNAGVTVLPADLIFSKGLLQLSCDAKIKTHHHHDAKNNETRLSLPGTLLPTSLKQISMEHLATVNNLEDGLVPGMVARMVELKWSCTFCRKIMYEPYEMADIPCPVRNVPVRSPASLSATLTLDNDDHLDQLKFGSGSGSGYMLRFVLCRECVLAAQNDVTRWAKLVQYGDVAVVRFLELLQRSSPRIESPLHLEHVDDTLGFVFGLQDPPSALAPTSIVQLYGYMPLL